MLNPLTHRFSQLPLSQTIPMPVMPTRRNATTRQRSQRQPPVNALQAPTTPDELCERIQQIQQCIDENVLTGNIICPVCLVSYRSRHGLTSHMSSAQTCSWYHLGKLELHTSSSETTTQPAIRINTIYELIARQCCCTKQLEE